MRYYVYTYSIDDVVFYVGKGQGNRYRTHLYAAFNAQDRRYNSHFYRKIRKLTRQGREAEIMVKKAASFKQERDALEHERHLITLYKRIGDEGTLCNVTLGGEGTSGYNHTEETKERIAVFSRNRQHTPEAKDKIRKSAIRQHQDPLAKINSPETKKKLSVARKKQPDPRLGTVHGEDSCAKISIKVRQAVSEGRGGAFIPSKETREKMSESLKGNQNAKGYKRTTQERKTISERMKGNALWLGKHHTEASKKKLSGKKKGGRWVNDGTQNKYLPSSEDIPEGWKAGRTVYEKKFKCAVCGKKYGKEGYLKKHKKSKH